MLRKIIGFSIEKRLFTFAAFVIIAIASLYSLNTAKVDAIPDIGENQQIVFTEWPGRSPKDIEEQISYPLSVNLQGIPGVKSIRSSSAFGFSSIYVLVCLFFKFFDVLGAVQMVKITPPITHLPF